MNLRQGLGYSRFDCAVISACPKFRTASSTLRKKVPASSSRAKAQVDEKGDTHTQAFQWLIDANHFLRFQDTGRNRVPWSVVRLLRLKRCGDLGALEDEWAGWTINRLGLHAPAGRTYREADMRHWWLTSEHARFWRESYDLATSGGVGAPAPAEGVELLRPIQN